MIVYTYTIWNEYDKTGVIITDVPKFFQVKCEYLLKAEVDVDLEGKLKAFYNSSLEVTLS